MAKIKIVEDYVDYSPPVEVYRSVQLLLRHVPEEHLKGLKQIVLTNSVSLLGSFKGKYWAGNERIRAADCRGLYSNFRIFLVMDQILREYPGVLLLIPVVKTFAIGEVLYHEIGHHIHKCQQPGYRDNKEMVADEWKEKLLQGLVRQRYWYLAKLAQVVLRLIERFQRSPTECDPEPA